MSNAKRRYRRRRRLNINHPVCPECLIRDWHKMGCSVGRHLRALADKAWFEVETRWPRGTEHTRGTVFRG